MKPLKLAIIISITLTALTSLLWFWFSKSSPTPVITDRLDIKQAAMAAVLKDLVSSPALALISDDNGYGINDDLQTGGITIEYPHRPEVKTGQEEKKKEELSIKLPPSLKDGLKIDLPGNREIIINNKTTQDTSAQTLSPPAPESSDLPDREALDKSADLKESYLSYREKDKRKEHYFAYQKDSAPKTVKLKHWLIYNTSNPANAQEHEEYEFINAK
jgi:hypothetical protein